MESPAPTVAKPTTTRLFGLDQARAVAILAMMIFHFAPGVFKELPKLAALQDPVLWFGRAATPMFVTVFGITSGFVFLPKFLRGEVAQTSQRLRRRAILILFCSLLYATPQWVRLNARSDYSLWTWVFALYSVLLFYTIALSILPLWLRFVSRQTLFRSLTVGIALWAAGTIGYSLWPGGAPSLPEFVRLLLLSGDYGYLQMMGTALLTIPVGLGLRRARDTGSDRSYLLKLFFGGIALCGLGAAWGWSIGEYDLNRIIAGELRIPPRPWYFLHFGSLALVALAGLEFLSRGVSILKGPMYVLALFGQVSLVLYTGHLFVLPLLEVLDHFTSLKGMVRVLAAFVPFGIFCVVMLYLRHRKQSNKSASA